MEVGIPIPLEVTYLVHSDHLPFVRAGLGSDDELLTNSPVITSVRLVQVGPSTRTDRKDTMSVGLSEVSELYPACRRLGIGSDSGVTKKVVDKGQEVSVQRHSTTSLD